MGRIGTHSPSRRPRSANLPSSLIEYSNALSQHYTSLPNKQPSLRLPNEVEQPNQTVSDVNLQKLYRDLAMNQGVLHAFQENDGKEEEGEQVPRLIQCARELL